MSCASLYDVPADEEMYRQVEASIGDDRPPGLIANVVVHTDGGLRHVGVWDSQEDWQRFHDEGVETRRPRRPRCGRVDPAAVG